MTSTTAQLRSIPKAVNPVDQLIGMIQCVPHKLRSRALKELALSGRWGKKTRNTVEDLLPHLPFKSCQLGDFELFEWLGSGATSIVMTARNTKTDARVALKLYTRAFNSSIDRHAVGEIQSVLALQQAAYSSNRDPFTHDPQKHIVSALDTQEACGWRFLVMECFEGPDLKGEVCGAKESSIHEPDNWKQALEWTIQVCHALELAHDANVYHRDLKPQNVLVHPSGTGVKVIDFGMAALGYAMSYKQSRTISNRRKASSSLIELSKPNHLVIGTDEYMAPEAALGVDVTRDYVSTTPEAEAVAREYRAIDVYGIGAILHAYFYSSCIRVRPPSLPDDEKALLAWIASDEYQLPNVAQSGSVASKTPRFAMGQVEFLLGRLLTSNPDDRMSSIKSVRVELERILSDTSIVPLSKHPRFAPHAARLWVRRNRYSIASAATFSAVVCLVGVLGFGVDHYKTGKDAAEGYIAKVEGDLADQKSRLEQSNKLVNQANADREMLRSALNAANQDVRDLHIDVEGLNAQVLGLHGTVGEKDKLLESRQRTIRKRNGTIKERDATIVDKNNEIVRKDQTIAERDDTISEKDRAIADREATIATRDATIVDKNNEIVRKDQTIAKRETTIVEKDRALADREATIATRNATIVEKDGVIETKTQAIADRDESIAKKNGEIVRKDNVIGTLRSEAAELREQNRKLQEIIDTMERATPSVVETASSEDQQQHEGP